MFLQKKFLRLIIVALIFVPLLIFGMTKAVGFLSSPNSDVTSQTIGYAQAADANATSVTQNPELKIYGFKLEEKDNSTYISIKTNRDFNYRIFSLTQPSTRLVIDFDRAAWKFGSPNGGLIAGKGLIKQIRYALKSEHQSRIVLDLQQPAKVISQQFSNEISGRFLVIRLANTDLKTFASQQPAQLPKSTKLIAPVSLKSGKQKYTIVIDAGHGGHDPGALGITKGVFEKDVTLASAILLRDNLRRDQRFNVIMTRSSDVFLPLEKRIIIARDLRADLFISLHADSAGTAKAQGATVYTLSEEGGDRSRRLLNRDNWTVVPPNRTNDNTVTEILRDLTQRDTKNQSAVFAENILLNIKDAGPLTSSSHRRAGFFVLLSPTVPAVLLEMGFITDPDDQARLINPEFRNRQMSGVARAIREYFDNKDLKK
jgi:N-acetylmuramoyl-L-alanine amidase